MTAILENDTIIAPITSTAGGSVSLLRISGPDALVITSRFLKNKSPDELKGGTFFYDKFLNEKDEIVDEVIVYIFREPRSFTGEDVIEIGCHANTFIIREVLKLFIRNGCRAAEPGEFSKRAFLNGKIDLVQAEAIADLIAAKSKSAVQNSLRQLGGRLSQLLNDIKSEVIDAASLLELELDFTEDDLEIIEQERISGLCKKSIKRIESLMDSYHFGRHLTRGYQVIITGKPNVGKSSLMNTFLDQQRVIVSETPGTTRDVIHEDIMINNNMIRFIDTAGIHLTDDTIESEGIERARTYIDHSDLILLLIDVSTALEQEDLNLYKTLRSMYRSKLMVVANKMDMGVDEETYHAFKFESIPIIQISAINGDGIEQLKTRISEFVSEGLHEAGEIMISNERQYVQLGKTKEALEHVIHGIDNQYGYEFIAVDMRTAIEHLSQITGAISTDDILNNIFSHFCVGK